jgi:tubulin polyglutamylase TTLL4
LKTNDFYEILEDFNFPPAYKPRMNKYKGMPKCIVDTCNNGSISLIKNEDNCNIIWKLLPPGKMRDLIRKLGKNQKFNHFPSTYQIGLKDNMYKHFKVYKRLFPKLYNFVPETYILPNDSDVFTNIYKKNKNTKWIVKPVNMSRGRGVHLLKDETELKSLIKKSYNENAIPDLISKYLDKPHLINNKKYDLRIYVLVASFIPLRFYIYYNGLVRFATEDYQKGNYDNVYIHITNYSINKNNLNYKANQKNNKEIEDLEEENENDEEDDSSKWSLVEYRNYFKKLGLNNEMENIWKQIEEIIIKSLITIANDNCKEMSVNKNNSLFELYGYDILIDESFRAWLIEVNVNPSLHCT